MSFLQKIKNFGKELKSEFARVDLLNHSAVIAFYTIFSLPSILFLLVNILGYFFEEEEIRNELVNKLQVLIDLDDPEMVHSIIKSVAFEDSSLIMKILGIGTLLFGATTVVISLQDALNDIINKKSKISFLKNLVINRFLSFSVILSFGFIMIVSLFVESIINIFLNNSSFAGLEIFSILVNHLFGFGAIILLFAMIYRFLPNINMKWSETFKSALVTSLLFYLGRVLIGIYLSNSSVLSVYGAAGSIIIIPVWIYYSSFVFLFGAMLSKVLFNLKN